MADSYLTEFGINVFGKKAMRDRLPKDVYERFVSFTEDVQNVQKLEPSIAGVIASAMKDWAVSRGATHYTHWFHPRTEMTAEKHQAFLSIDKDGYPLDSLTAAELIQSEPDASSFPSGGVRSTFEARGYTAWDPSSPAFIMERTLFIPSVFISYDGTPLDLKTPLLKSLHALETRAMRIAKLFGNRGVRFIRMTVGTEQEFFLMNAEKARLRPDVLFCSRTLQGALPPKGQQMDDHYFGSIHHKALAYMEDVGEELARLGIVVKTRHNEAAPGQFEFAPDFSEANLACDQNQITMITLRRAAHKHGLRAILHEKPYEGLNGSGKHTNFALMDSEGRNLLSPSTNPRRNVQFLTYLCAFLIGTAKYGGILRQAAACPGNMFRLGGNEAPPAIVSVYLGDVLTCVLEQIEQGKTPKNSTMDLGLNRLPSIIKDNTDRNRTAPIAFTGNKFEFRAPGSSQSPAGPLTAIAAVWSYGMDVMSSYIEEGIAKGADACDAAMDAIEKAVKDTKNVCFDGNCYSEEWAQEAKKRGLIDAKSTPQGLNLLLEQKNRDLLRSLGIYKEAEITSYYETRMEQFVKTIEIDMGILEAMAWEGFIPALNAQIKDEGSIIIINANTAALTENEPLSAHLSHLMQLKAQIITAIGDMCEIYDRIGDENASENSIAKLQKQAELIVQEGIPAMEKLRSLADKAEKRIAKDYWPYPRYRELASLS